jgi:diguanylate cyclase (GGDEF)-like protein
METRIILVVASILLTGECIGLVIVRLTNPFFRGAGWLGASFAFGALGATVFTLRSGRWENVVVVVAYSLVLLSFALQYVSFLKLSGAEFHLPKLGTSLLLLQVLIYAVFRNFHAVGLLTVVVFGFAVALQISENAWLLHRTHADGMDAPVRFNIALLLILAVFNIARSLIILVRGFGVSPLLPNPLEAISAVIFLGTAIGLGFGVFWMEGHQIGLALQQLANIDPLTGIHNRRSFIALCEQELLKTSRNGDAFSLIMFDVDHFKRINDRYGHRTGDVVICAAVEKLRNSVRNIDIVGRWGGEEFVALLPKADAEAAIIVANRLREHVDAIAIPSPRTHDSGGRRVITITVSIGITTYKGYDPTVTIQDLLHQCDSAMYQAKAEGRDRIFAFESPLMLVH